MPKVKIIGKSFKEKRTCERSFIVYPTDHGNLTANEIALIEGVKVQDVRNKIYNNLEPEVKDKIKELLKKQKNKKDKL